VQLRRGGSAPLPRAQVGGQWQPKGSTATGCGVRGYNTGMATAAKPIYPHITKNPGVCSGRPCVEGTRVRVVDVVALHEAGLSAEQIVEELSTLGGPADVFAALLYYHDHKNEIDADVAEDAALAARYERDHHAK